MTQPPTTDDSRAPTAGASIPVTEERLEIGHRVTESGRVRVRKHVDEEPVRATAAVTRETVDVERVPVGRVVEQAPPVRREGNVTIVPVVEERLVTRKELVLVLVEEIHLTQVREVEQAGEDVTLRRERVVVERFDPDSGLWLAEHGPPAPR